MIGALLLLWPPLHTLYVGFTTAPINDVTTNPEDPPQFVALARRGPGMNSPLFDNLSRIHFRGESGTPAAMSCTSFGHYSWLTTEPHAVPRGCTTSNLPLVWFWRDFETVKRMGWRIVSYDEKAGRIEATATSFWFGQVTDIVLRVEPAGTKAHGWMSAPKAKAAARISAAIWRC